ncbi:MAG: PhzF family phenazine biosynthesis protein [Marinobacterium sp.]|nr:PhzF family phenazine biosynthesis protein [Marinobacterium sp.]
MPEQSNLSSNETLLVCQGKSLRYLLLDVFTDQVFGGNQLAVFPDANGLNVSQMQQLACELNLAETTFVQSGEHGQSPRVYIFTPACEVDFAGHPTIGTAIALGYLTHSEGTSQWTLLENVGPVPVQVTQDNQRWWAQFEVAQLPQVRTSEHTLAQLASVVSLPESALLSEPCWSSCGLPFEVIELSSRQALAQAVADGSRWQQVIGDDPNASLYLFCREGEQIFARMFGIAVGITEDPATGSAAAALAGVLALSLEDGEYTVAITQGVEMGRPSQIKLCFSVRAGQAVRVSVGGSAVLMGEGQFCLPWNDGVSYV